MTNQAGLINIDQPRYDQSMYSGRAKHFYLVTNPFNLLKSDAALDRAKTIVDDYRQGKLTGISEDELWRAKYLYDSAFHPETGDKMFVFGRMSAQAPMNTLVIVGLLASYRSTPASLFWQWFNQSFNAVINFSNRSGGHMDNRQLAAAYICATGGALMASYGLKAMSPRFPPLLARMTPFMAVAFAHAINIPMMRNHELREGTNVMNERDEVVGKSQKTARRAIAQVTVSRILMVGSTMVVPAVVMHELEKRGPMARRPFVNVGIQAVLCGFMMAVATPLACALFAQRRSIAVRRLEPDLRAQLHSRGYTDDQLVYYNKGL